MKKMIFSILGMLVVFSLAGCGGEAPFSEALSESEMNGEKSEEISEIFQSDIHNEISEQTSGTVGDSLNELDEMGLPKMTPENQAIYNQYIEPYISAGILLVSFRKDAVTHFNANRVYSSITKPVVDADVPQEVVEEVVGKYFPVTAEQMRKRSGIEDYNEEKGTYFVLAYQPVNYSRGVITNLVENDETYTITCDWYTTVYTDEPEGTYNLYATAEIVIDTKTGAYISNDVTVK